MSVRVTPTTRGGIEMAEFGLKVVPKASPAGPAGVHDGRLKLRLASAPEQGKANDEAVEWVAKLLEVPRAAVAIVLGATTRQKVVRISGLPADEVARRLALHLDDKR
jgi:uncharacterized protein (TIGR00251 family)